MERHHNDLVGHASIGQTVDGFVVIGKVAKWLGIALLVGMGLAAPWLGLAMLAAWFFIRKESKKTIEDDHERLRGKMRWCPDCNRNVRPVRSSPSGGALLATGGLGYVIRDRNSCPLCRNEVLEFPHAAST